MVSRASQGSASLSRVQARSRRRILDAARRLVEADGLDRLSMRDLAAEADVSVRTIYNVVGHFQQHTGQIVFATKILRGEDLGLYRPQPV